jgi:hypothetical protein
VSGGEVGLTFGWKNWASASGAGGSYHFRHVVVDALVSATTADGGGDASGR